MATSYATARKISNDIGIISNVKVIFKSFFTFNLHLTIKAPFLNGQVLSLSKNPDSGTRIGVKNLSETKIEIKAEKNEEQTEVSIRTPSPDGEFFEVHGSKFKTNICEKSQAEISMYQ